MLPMSEPPVKAVWAALMTTAAPDVSWLPRRVPTPEVAVAAPDQ